MFEALFDQVVVFLVNLCRNEVPPQFLAFDYFRSASAEKSPVPTSPCLVEASIKCPRKSLGNLAGMECLCEPDVFHHVEVKPRIGHPPRLAARDQFLDSLVGWILVWNGNATLVELVVLGFCAVEYRPVGGREFLLAVPNVGVVHPDVFIYVEECVIQVL